MLPYFALAVLEVVQDDGQSRCVLGGSVLSIYVCVGLFRRVRTLAERGKMREVARDGIVPQRFCTFARRVSCTPHIYS